MTNRRSRALRRRSASRGYDSVVGYKSVGYTMVEVMMALAVLAIGAVGIVSLQKVTVMGGLNSRNLTGATDAGMFWIEQLQGEASVWNQADNSDITDMPTLSPALASGNWYRIPGTPGGGSVVDGSSGSDIIYCTQIRATYVGPAPAAGVGATSTLRLETRTFFGRDGHPLGSECTGASAAADIDTMLATEDGTAGGHFRHEYGFVFMTATIRRNSL